MGTRTGNSQGMLTSVCCEQGMVRIFQANESSLTYFISSCPPAFLRPKERIYFCISSFTESLLGRGLALPGLYWLFCSTINTILSSLIYIFLIRWERGDIQKEAEQWSRRVTVLLCWLTELHFSCALWPVVPLHSRTVLVQSMVWLTCASLEKRSFLIVVHSQLWHQPISAP